MAMWLVVEHIPAMDSSTQALLVISPATSVMIKWWRLTLCIIVRIWTFISHSVAADRFCLCICVIIACKQPISKTICNNSTCNNNSTKIYKTHIVKFWAWIGGAKSICCLLAVLEMVNFSGRSFSIALTFSHFGYGSGALWWMRCSVNHIIGCIFCECTCQCH